MLFRIQPTAEELVRMARDVVVVRGYIGSERGISIHLVTALDTSLVWGKYYEVLKSGDHFNDQVRFELMSGNSSLVERILLEWDRMCPALLNPGELVITDGTKEIHGVDQTFRFLMTCARIQALIMQRIPEDDPSLCSPIVALLWRRFSAFVSQRVKPFEDFSEHLRSPFSWGPSYPLPPGGKRAS